MLVEILRKLSNSHNFGVCEVNSPDKHSILDVLNLLFNVVSVLEYTALCFLEWFDTILALSYEFRNAEREPVVILLTLVHQAIKLVDVLLE